MSGNALTRMFRGAFPSGGAYNPVNTDVSLLERSFAQITGSSAELLEPGTYLALVDITLDLMAGRVAFLRSGVAMSSAPPPPPAGAGS